MAAEDHFDGRNRKTAGVILESRRLSGYANSLSSMRDHP